MTASATNKIDSRLDMFFVNGHQLVVTLSPTASGTRSGTPRRRAHEGGEHATTSTTKAIGNRVAWPGHMANDQQPEQHRRDEEAPPPLSLAPWPSTSLIRWTPRQAERSSAPSDDPTAEVPGGDDHDADERPGGRATALVPSSQDARRWRERRRRAAASRHYRRSARSALDRCRCERGTDSRPVPTRRRSRRGMRLSKRLRITPSASPPCISSSAASTWASTSPPADDEDERVGELRQVHRVARGQHRWEVEQQVVELPRQLRGRRRGLAAGQGRPAGDRTAPAGTGNNRGFWVGMRTLSTQRPRLDDVGQAGGVRGVVAGGAASSGRRWPPTLRVVGDHGRQRAGDVRDALTAAGAEATARRDGKPPVSCRWTRATK